MNTRIKVIIASPGPANCTCVQCEREAWPYEEGGPS